MFRLRNSLFCALCLVFTLPLSASGLKTGQSAPPLQFTDLLQAPEGAKVDWPSLKGKVVILEFWATWCSGCIENIPHLNKLVDSLDKDKFVFISIDDEDPEVVKKFIAKTPIRGWLGIDTTGKTLKGYENGLDLRPRTFVINAEGKVVTQPIGSLLTAESLQALADGKNVEFPADPTFGKEGPAINQAKEISSIAEGKDGTKPIFEISVRPGDPSGKIMMTHSAQKDGEPFTMDVLNGNLPMLFAFTKAQPTSRLKLINIDTTARYTLHIAAPGGSIEDLAPAITSAIASAAGAKMHFNSSEEDALILTRTEENSPLLRPSTATQIFCFYNARDSKLMMMHSSLSELASQLENALGKPVVDETGSADLFDANLDLPPGDLNAANNALQKSLGLKLAPARRKIERLILEAPAKPDTPTAK